MPGQGGQENIARADGDPAARRPRRGALQAEVGGADLVVAEEVGGGAVHGDAAVFDDVAAVGDGEAVDDVLLDDEDGDAALADVLDTGEAWRSP